MIKLGKKAGVIIAVLIIIVVAVALVSYEQKEEPIPAKSQLTLADYPEIFKKDVIIVIGRSASSIEMEAAQAIADNFGDLTGNVPVIKTDTEITEDDKLEFNLILMGRPEMNSVLMDVYMRTNATRVTHEYPGAGKGVLEILRNPWNPEKAMLLVAGSDEWGVKAGSGILANSEMIKEISGETMVTEFKLFVDDEMKELAEKKAKELFDKEISVTNLEIPLLTDFFEVHKTYRVRGYSEGYPYPVTHVVAVSRDGYIFVLPEDFNKTIKKEHMQVKDEKEALKLAKGYILIRDDEEMKDIATFLQNVSDIPWKLQPDYAKDPTEYSIIKPPYVSSKNETYTVKIYTWHQIGGEIIEWVFEIKSNGELIAQKNEIADYAGDCGLPTFV